MKKFKLIYALIAGTLLLASCSNELPAFDDKDAFVAFTASEMQVSEDGGELDIPVLLTSLSGTEATVDFEILSEESTAIEGTHFSVEGTKSVSFTKDAPLQTIKLKIIDDDVFGGNVKLIIALKNPHGVNLGASKECLVTIEDNEHPLSIILGTYHTSADSYFDSRGSFDWNVTISRDETDLSKIWISNLEPYFASNGYVAPKANYFYGVVNSEKTEIRVPVRQAIGYKDEGVDVVLAGFSGVDPDESDELDAGANIIISILENGQKLRIENAYGAVSEGWWNLMYGNQIMTKQ